MSAKPKFNFVLLAAGKSERMQTDKALLQFKGQSWIQAQISEIRRCALIDQIFVVCNPKNHQALLQAVDRTATVLVNKERDADAFSSLRIGLQAAGSAKAVFISPIDVPQSARVLDDLAVGVNSGCKAVIPTFDSKRGHPVLLIPLAIKDLLNPELEFDRLDLYLRGLLDGELQLLNSSEPKILLNLNTPQAWQDFLD